jgi:beta-glucosidase
LSLAATWDDQLVGQVGAAIAQEFRGKGANVLLGPGVNVHRSPFGGRNFEYLSGEDPYLGTRLAEAYVKSVQGEGIMAVMKHFAFNEQETVRRTESSVVDDKTAWELYYPPFEAAVQAGVGAVMCSYNSVNGTNACQNANLLLRDLKGRMGFEGFVMSDWGAVNSAIAIEHGLDMEQPSGNHFTPKTLVPRRQAVQGAVRRILAAIYHLRLDQDPECALPCFDKRKSIQRTPAHVSLALRAAVAGVVLLKNEGKSQSALRDVEAPWLPLQFSRVKKLAIVGAAATAKDTMNTWGPGSPYSGGGSGHIATSHVVTPLHGISERAKKEGISIVVPKDSTLAAAEKAAAKADLVVVVAAATAREAHDRASLSLDDDADELIALMAKRRPTVVLLEVPGAVLTPWRDEVVSVACLFAGGEQTGYAWAAVLFGDAQPEGRLPIELPASKDGLLRPGKGEVRYSERSATSYRSPLLKAFPFGHGLSYTRFEYGEPWVYTDGCPGTLCFVFVVSNVGDRPGCETAQVYVEFRRSEEPQMWLRGFQRTGVLKPGSSESMLFSLSRRELSTYWPGRGWYLEPAARIHIGASSADVRRSFQLHPHEKGAWTWTAA